jgi:hypothetical protein
MKKATSSWATVVSWIVLGAAMTVGIALAACSSKLPEPESEAAQLYVKYCSGSGCHDPIPPQVDSKGYWDNQYKRMILLMRDKGLRVPDAREDALIRDYLEKNAAK